MKFLSWVRRLACPTRPAVTPRRTALQVDTLEDRLTPAATAGDLVSLARQVAFNNAAVTAFVNNLPAISGALATTPGLGAQLGQTYKGIADQSASLANDLAAIQADLRQSLVGNVNRLQQQATATTNQIDDTAQQLVSQAEQQLASMNGAEAAAAAGAIRAAEGQIVQGAQAAKKATFDLLGSDIAAVVPAYAGADAFVTQTILQNTYNEQLGRTIFIQISPTTSVAIPPTPAGGPSSNGDGNPAGGQLWVAVYRDQFGFENTLGDFFPTEAQAINYGQTHQFINYTFTGRAEQL